MLSASPNPVVNNNTIRYHLATPANVTIAVYDVNGKQVNVLANKYQQAGTYTTTWNASRFSKGIYFVSAIINGQTKQSLKLVKE
jgi:endoglucanase